MRDNPVRPGAFGPYRTFCAQRPCGCARYGMVERYCAAAQAILERAYAALEADDEETALKEMTALDRHWEEQGEG